MKRIFGMIVIFLIIVGGVYLVLTMSSGKGGNNIVLEDACSADEIESLIIHEWSTATEWDGDLFADIQDQIEMSRIAELITPNQERQLKDLNCARASLVIVPIAQKEFRKNDCSKSVISKCSNGISTIRKAGFSNSDTKLTGSCCATFLNIMEFIGSDNKPSAELSYTNGEISWADYADFSNKQNEQLSLYKEDDIYKKYLSGITEINVGLEQKQSNLNAGIAGYYSAIYENIVSLCNIQKISKLSLINAQREYNSQIASLDEASRKTLSSLFENYVNSFGE